MKPLSICRAVAHRQSGLHTTWVRLPTVANGGVTVTTRGTRTLALSGPPTHRGRSQYTRPSRPGCNVAPCQQAQLQSVHKTAALNLSSRLTRTKQQQQQQQHQSRSNSHSSGSQQAGSRSFTVASLGGLLGTILFLGASGADDGEKNGEATQQVRPDEAMSYAAARSYLSGLLTEIRSQASAAIWPPVKLVPSASNHAGSFSVHFEISPKTDIGDLISTLASSLGELKVYKNSNSKWECTQLNSMDDALVIMICRGRGRTSGSSFFSHEDEDDGGPLPGQSDDGFGGPGNGFPQGDVLQGGNGGVIRMYFQKDGLFTGKEISAIAQTYSTGSRSVVAAVNTLSKFGLELHKPSPDTTWNDIAGYEHVKKEIQSTIVHAMMHPDLFDQITQATRAKPESNKPKAILFEGPPGTGKTTTARIIASQVNIPMVYIPIEAVVSKWYGDSEKKLGQIFKACSDLGSSIIFIDEIDSLAATRGQGDMHEATRRVLSVLLRKIEGFEKDDRTIVIGATNRKTDLDPALLSRFDVFVRFPVPNAVERKGIFKLYAKHLRERDLEKLAEVSETMAGRDIRDVCAHAERAWASEIISKHTEQNKAVPKKIAPPSVDVYLKSLHKRQMGMSDI